MKSPSEIDHEEIVHDGSDDPNRTEYMSLSESSSDDSDSEKIETEAPEHKEIKKNEEKKVDESDDEFLDEILGKITALKRKNVLHIIKVWQKDGTIGCTRG